MKLRRSCVFGTLLLAAACGGGAGVPWLTAPTPTTHDKFFPIAAGPHAVGQGTPATTCNTCHGNTDSFKVFDCVTCHAQAPTAAKHNNQGGYEWASASCYACHPRGAGTISAEAHAAFFPIGPGQTHAIDSPAVHAPGTFTCTTCHTGSDRAQVDCTGCHTRAQMTTSAGASFHAAVPDLTWPSPATPGATSLLCLRCHSDGKLPVSITSARPSRMGRHDTTNASIVFPVTAGAPHETTNPGKPMACLTCHSATTAPVAANPAYLVADFTQQECTACHLSTGTLQQDVATLHKGVTTPAPGFVPVPSPVTPAYSKTCLLCHADGLLGSAQNHTAFAIGPTDPHAYGKTLTVGGVAVATSCSSCHVDPSNRRNVDCTGCHVQSGSNGPPGPTVPADQTTAHSGKLGTTGAGNPPWLGTGPVGAGSGASASCLLCHGLGARGPGFVAAHGQASPATGHAVFPLDSRSNHFVACAQCHTQTTTGAVLKNPEMDFTRASCTACHAASGTGSIVADHAAIPYQGQPGVPIDTGVYTPSNANNAAACLSCHGTGSQAAGFAHASFPLTSAANAITAGGTAFAHSTVAKCAGCHTPGQPVTSVAAITCRGCHSDTNPAGQNGATLTAKHSVGAVIWTVPGRWSAAPAGSTSATDSSLCLQCHAGNNTSSRSASKLVMRLAGHDSGCSPRKSIGGGGDHSVSQNGNNGAGSGQPACFVCHNAMEPGARSWTRNWASVNNGTLGCQGCHEHAGENPGYSQCP